MSAPPVGMGGIDGMGDIGASDVPPMPTDGAFGDSGNTVRVSNDDEDAREDEEEEDEEEEEENET